MNCRSRSTFHLSVAQFAAVLILASTISRSPGSEPSEVFALWPDAKAAPGESRARGEESLLTERRRPFYQITNVTMPTVSVFLAPVEKRTGAAVLVCPGGGMQRLAIEHEGFEVAQWLNSRGLAAFVLKYRVPAPSHTGMIDAQRAMGLVRRRADEFDIDANRLGIIGFSAGGEVAVLLATQFDKREYEPVDAADELSSRPDAVCLVYPGGIASRRNGGLRDDIASRLDAATTPPMFIVHAFPDASMNSLALATALKQARVPCELHLYQDGGHGFGARESKAPLSSWKKRYEEWLAGHGFFDRPSVGKFAAAFVDGVDGDGPLLRLSAMQPSATLADGYAAQRRIVRRRSASDQVVGFKVAKAIAADQAAAGVDEPITGALLRSGRIDAADDDLVVEIGDQSCVVETEIGYIIGQGAEISTRIESLDHVKSAVEAIAPVIEMPVSLGSRMEGELTAADVAAINAGAARFIVGQTRVSPDDLDPNVVHVSLTRDGETLHEDAPADVVKGGQWSNLRDVINSVVDQGYTLRGGDVIVSGALGKVHPAEPGNYEAVLEGLGTIRFELK